MQKVKHVRCKYFPKNWQWEGGGGEGGSPYTWVNVIFIAIIKLNYLQFRELVA